LKAQRNRLRGDRPARQHVIHHVQAIIREQNLRPGDLLPTYQQLAKIIGVSYVTVKRGLDDLEFQGLVRRVPSKGTFVTKELVFLPRPLKRLGLIHPSTREILFSFPYLIDILRGITADAPMGMDMHVFSIREDGMVSAAQLADEDVDGVILLSVENDEYLRAFADWGTPGIVVDYCSSKQPMDCVACDNRAAAQKMADYLLGLGHRRVAYASSHEQSVVKGPTRNRLTNTLMIRNSSDSRERLEETILALRERHILSDVWGLPFGGWAAFVAEEIRHRASHSMHPTAILTDNNYALMLLKNELQQRGLRVPEDISLGAIASDTELSSGISPTACRFDFNAMGRTAVRLLAERCQKPQPPAGTMAHRIGFQFMEGQTVSRVS